MSSLVICGKRTKHVRILQKATKEGRKLVYKLDNRDETKGGKLSLVNFISLYALYIAQLSTLVFPSAPLALFML